MKLYRVDMSAIVQRSGYVEVLAESESDAIEKAGGIDCDFYFWIATKETCAKAEVCGVTEIDVEARKQAGLKWIQEMREARRDHEVE